MKDMKMSLIFYEICLRRRKTDFSIILWVRWPKAIMDGNRRHEISGSIIG